MPSHVAAHQEDYGVPFNYIILHTNPVRTLFQDYN